MSKIKCISRYKHDPRNIAFNPGDTIEDEALIAFLMVDAPGCFEVVKEQKALSAPPKNKAVQSAPNKAAVDLEDKTVAELKDMAKEAGITGYSTMLKAELVDELS